MDHLAAAFAEAERERITTVKQDQKARGRYLGGKVPFGYRVTGDGNLIEHKAEQDAIRAMRAMRAQGIALRPIAAAMAERGFRISHEAVKQVMATRGIATRQRL